MSRRGKPNGLLNHPWRLIVEPQTARWNSNRGHSWSAGVEALGSRSIVDAENDKVKD